MAACNIVPKVMVFVEHEYFCTHGQDHLGWQDQRRLGVCWLSNALLPLFWYMSVPTFTSLSVLTFLCPFNLTPLAYLLLFILSSVLSFPPFCCSCPAVLLLISSCTTIKFNPFSSVHIIPSTWTSDLRPSDSPSSTLFNRLPRYSISPTEKSFLVCMVDICISFLPISCPEFLTYVLMRTVWTCNVCAQEFLTPRHAGKVNSVVPADWVWDSACAVESTVAHCLSGRVSSRRLSWCGTSFIAEGKSLDSWVLVLTRVTDSYLASLLCPNLWGT